MGGTVILIALIVLVLMSTGHTLARFLEAGGLEGWREIATLLVFCGILAGLGMAFYVYATGPYP